MTTTTDPLLDEYRAAAAADEDEALRCPHCGVTGFAPCRLDVHLATLTSFAAYASRATRVDAFRKARKS